MAIGFAQTSTSKEDIIRSLQRSYLVDSEYLEQQREEWNEFYSNRMCKEFSKEMLFTPSRYSYSGLENGTGIIMNPNLQSYHSRDGHRTEAKIVSGFWGLQVLRHTYGAKTKHYQEWDFTITVWAGGRYVFHPEQAYRIITRYHSHAVYEEWRKVVASDLDNFKAVIDAYNPPANMFSVTCCPSSERVCKRLGIPVRNGFAFLTHRKGETCQHKTGTFTPVLN
jgi:hypothetical protein